MPRPIKLTQEKNVIVDQIDYEYLHQHKWHASFTPSINNYYARRREGGKFIAMHRLIMETKLGRPLKKEEVVDHIDNDPLNNQRSNLRVVSNRQNTQNRKRKTASKYPGLYWRKDRSRWVARIMVDGKIKYLGHFTSEREAAKAYEEACRNLVGEELVCKVHP